MLCTFLCSMSSPTILTCEHTCLVNQCPLCEADVGLQPWVATMQLRQDAEEAIQLRSWSVPNIDAILFRRRMLVVVRTSVACGINRICCNPVNASCDRLCVRVTCKCGIVDQPSTPTRYTVSGIRVCLILFHVILTPLAYELGCLYFCYPFFSSFFLLPMLPATMFNCNFSYFTENS